MLKKRRGKGTGEPSRKGGEDGRSGAGKSGASTKKGRFFKCAIVSTKGGRGR